jgi:hypothetical protein
MSIPWTDDEVRTRKLCFEKLRDAGEELLAAYWVVRDGQPVEVAQDDLTPAELRIIRDALVEMGAAELHKAEALEREGRLLEAAGYWDVDGNPRTDAAGKKIWNDVQRQLGKTRILQ